MISAPTQMQNNSGGNGRGYVPMRKKEAAQTEVTEDSIDKLNSLNDPRMRFKNSRDPVLIAFDYVERKSIKWLAKEFVKDIINDGLSFITKK